MCWKIVSEKKDAVWRRAGEDIPVFKVVRAAAEPGRGVPLYYGSVAVRTSPEGDRRYAYEPGGTYYPDYFLYYGAEPGDYLASDAELDYGMHSYSPGCGLRGRDGWIPKGKRSELAAVMPGNDPDLAPAYVTSDFVVAYVTSENDPEFALDYFKRDNFVRFVERDGENPVCETEENCLLLMRCAIPAGAVYAKNSHGEYVSSAIRVDGFEPFWEDGRGRRQRQGGNARKKGEGRLRPPFFRLRREKGEEREISRLFPRSRRDGNRRRKPRFFPAKKRNKKREKSRNKKREKTRVFCA